MDQSDEMLDQLAMDVDTELLRWITTFEMPPLSLSAVVLARLAWLAKIGNYEKDFLELLEHPKEILNKDESPVKMVH